LNASPPPSAIYFGLRCSRINRIKAPNQASAPRATPTPIPGFVPVERPEHGWGVLVADGFPVVELVAEVEVVVDDVVRGAMSYPLIGIPHA
jgi:hypothetical protein